jgi:CysZ protein
LALEISRPMRPVVTSHLFSPSSRAISQLDDPTFRGVLVRSICWSVACFAALHVAAVWIIHRALALHGWLAWGADILGSVAASMLAFWLFLPVAAMIGTMYFDRIALSVERRFYPWLPPPNGASLLEQAWDGIAVALQVLALNVVALILAFVLPGIGLILGWMIAAYAIGRGLFVAVAMRRMPRAMAYIPVVNLLLPIIGIAAMVHVLDMVLTASRAGRTAGYN